MIFLRTEHNYDMKAVSDETALKDFGPSKTQKHQLEEADINTIVKRFNLTGQLPTNVKMPQYGDFTGISDYRTALHVVMEAKESFMQMPSNVRKRFNNDPQLFVEFCSDPQNLEEAKKLGLVEKKSETATVEPPAKTEPAASQA